MWDSKNWYVADTCIMCSHWCFHCVYKGKGSLHPTCCTSFFWPYFSDMPSTPPPLPHPHPLLPCNLHGPCDSSSFVPPQCVITPMHAHLLVAIVTALSVPCSVIPSWGNVIPVNPDPACSFPVLQPARIGTDPQKSTQINSTTSPSSLKDTLAY